MTSILSPVAGVTFCEDYPDNLHRLHALIAEHGRPEEGIAAVLVRDPDNAYDANAVQVHVPAIGRVGSLPRTLAARVAPSMDAGDQWTAEVTGVRIKADHEDRPGVDLLLAKVEKS